MPALYPLARLICKWLDWGNKEVSVGGFSSLHRVMQARLRELQTSRKILTYPLLQHTAQTLSSNTDCVASYLSSVLQSGKAAG